MQFRSKSWRLTTAITLLLIVGFIIGSKLIDGDDSPAKVGLVNADPNVSIALKSSAATVGSEVETQTFANEAEAIAALESKSLEAVLLTNTTPPTAVVNSELSDVLHNAFNVLSSQFTLNQQIQQLGGDPASVAQALDASEIDVRALDPPREYSSDELAIGVVAGILVYLSLMMSGQLIAQGVVEEKSSRVVELLLSTIQPWQLMAGKVLGLGLTGFVQITVIGGIGTAVAIATNVLTISTSAAVGTIAWLVVWFVLGYFLYALVFAALAALVSRQEEVGGIITPAMLPLIAGYIAGVSILPSEPSNPVIASMSLIPIFAPTLMPMRIAMGGVPGWQLAVSAGLVAALLPLLTWLCGRIYRHAVMQTGPRVKLFGALRASPHAN